MLGVFEFIPITGGRLQREEERVVRVQRKRKRKGAIGSAREENSMGVDLVNMERRVVDSSCQPGSHE